MTLPEIAELKTADGNSIIEYLRLLLKVLWQEAEGFSGKRPFGNSGWQFDVYHALVKQKVIAGKLSADGWIEEADTDEGDKIILAIIDKLIVKVD